MCFVQGPGDRPFFKLTGSRLKFQTEHHVRPRASDLLARSWQLQANLVLFSGRHRSTL